MDKPWKIILLLVGIFLTGATTGGLVAVRVAKERVERPRPPPVDQWAHERLRKLNQRLGLAPEQLEQLRPILRRDMEELGRIRSQSVAESQRVVDRMEKDIAARLTPEQRVEYDKIKKETAERFRRIMQDREKMKGSGAPGERRSRSEHGAEAPEGGAKGSLPADGKPPGGDGDWI